MMTKPPCKECGSRYLGCHANCTKYIEFRRKRDDELHAVSKDNMITATIKINTRHRCETRRRRRGEW